jgi:hypothetical protein
MYCTATSSAFYSVSLQLVKFVLEEAINDPDGVAHPVFCADLLPHAAGAFADAWVRHCPLDSASQSLYS